ncbi:hypothetical protein F2Q68_00042879 [Brassica cretica]|uniref:very-long-chain 3-oxoacyl-CoA synthase n=1 Tax=Brassica cretica TaxID=69181 RepID=A0A8S9MFY7_BRACR|nr:hypothetical protein F2Q68_00042879 [Brassica cretica]
MDQERLTAEMAFKDSSSAVIRIRRRLPDFLTSVKLKYVKLGLHNSFNFTTFLFLLIILPLTGTVLVQLTGLTFETFSELWYNHAVQLDGVTRLACLVSLCFVLIIYVTNRSKPVYLVDFSCYKPEDERKMSVDSFLKMTEQNGAFTDDTYELVNVVRTHKGSDDKNYNCVYQKEDERGTIGVSLARELMSVAGDALKTNITTLGPMVLPLSEQLMFLVSLVKRKLLKLKVKPYIPDFKLAFEHFCIHAGGRAVLDEVQKNLDLKDWHMEPSRMTLHRFGNTSSSSLWYEMAYTEAKGRVKAGDRLWQIAFGSGFKCNSAVWKALRVVSTEEMTGNAWAGSIEDYPVKIMQ